ncbi:MAG: CDP-alcohol phosphatidyltransferase family protein [Candidatus Paceibacterota bacterium]
MFSDELRKLFSNITTGAGKFIGSLGISANFVTFLVLITGIIAAYYIYMGVFYLAIIFVLVSGILDGLDGAVAKAMKKETKFGGLFDSTTDKLTEILIYIALGLYNPQLWLPASLAISFFMLSSYISKHAKASGGKSQGGLLERKERIILIVLGLFFIKYVHIVLWIIAVASLFTASQRFAKNYKILSAN